MKNSVKEINFVTTNKNKLSEASKILGIQVNSINLDLLETQSLSVIDVVSSKVKDAYDKAGTPVIVEDTGLVINCLNGLPGALIKWFMDSVGNEGIIKIISAYEDKLAKAITVVAYYDGIEIQIFTGEINGKISSIVLGEKGFGWDKIFIPNGSNLTFAQMTPKEKLKFSMRTIAFLKMKESLLQ
jgi:XTP/dITP diphosphohydrolase